MTDSESKLFQYFAEQNIAVETHEHAAVFTVEQAQSETGHLPGGHCKNLFLKDKKGALYLVVCLDSQTIKINHIQKLACSARMSFAKPEILREILGVEPGSVTPYALINDGDRTVQPLLDRRMMTYDMLNFHPLRNDATTTIAPADLVKFIEGLGYDAKICDLDPPSS